MGDAERTPGGSASFAVANPNPTAILINTSHGPLINEADLTSALNSGRIAGAAFIIDVLSVEPPPQENPLPTVRNCLLTAHMAWAATEARHRSMATVIENVAAFLHGQPRNMIF